MDFARGLRDLGVEIVSTGGTARAIQQAGVAVREVSELTGFPEMLDGRLKTINPRIAGGVLAIRANAEHMQSLAEHDIPTIDMVVVNLYGSKRWRRSKGVRYARADREHRHRRAHDDSRGGQELSGCRGGDFAGRLSGDPSGAA